MTAEQMAMELNISRRTLFRDLQSLQDIGVVFTYEPGRRSYRLEETTSLPVSQLTAEEATSLLLVLRRLTNRESLPIFDTVSRVTDKIERGLPPAIREHCQRMLDGVSIRWQPLVDANRADGVFDRIHRAVGERRTLRIQYDSFHEGQVIETVLKPYRLVFVSRAWYVVAPSSRHNDQVRTFKLERMIEVESLDETFERNGDFCLEDYFGDAWSMIPEGLVRRVRLRFLPKVAGTVEEVTWHRSQQVSVQPDGSCVFEADVDGLGEIVWWVLGYGDQVVVEEPLELRHRIREIAQNMIFLAQETTTAEVSAPIGGSEQAGDMLVQPSA